MAVKGTMDHESRNEEGSTQESKSKRVAKMVAMNKEGDKVEDSIPVSVPKSEFISKFTKTRSGHGKVEDIKYPTPSERVKSVDTFHDTADSVVSTDVEEDDLSDSDCNDERPGTSCDRCSSLSKLVCPQVRRFIKCMMNFAEGELERDESKQPAKSNFLQCLPIPAGVKKVEISSGSGLYLSKPAKAKILLNCNNDPYKLARNLLVTLFGNQIKSEGVSAMGKGKEAGIEEPYLLAMYEFIKRNTNTEAPPGLTKDGKPKRAFTYPVFIKELNRKMGSSRRARKGKSEQRKDMPDVFGSSLEDFGPPPEVESPGQSVWTTCSLCKRRFKTLNGMHLHMKLHCKMRSLSGSASIRGAPEQLGTGYMSGQTDTGNATGQIAAGQSAPDPLHTGHTDPFELCIVKVEAPDNDFEEN